MSESVKVQIVGDASGLMAALQQASSAVNNHVGDIAAGFAVGTLAVKGFELAVEGIKKAFEAIPQAVEKFLAVTDTMHKLRYETGESYADLNTFNAAMKMTGGSLEELEGWMKGATRAIKKHKEEIIATGGANVKAALDSGKFKDYLIAVVEKSKDFQAGFERNQFLVSAMGRAGMEAGPQLLRFVEVLKEAKETAEKYGVELGEDDVAAMEKLEKTTGKVKFGLEMMQIAIAKELMPSIQELATWVSENLLLAFTTLKEWVDKNKQAFVDLGKASKNTATNLGEIAKLFANIGGSGEGAAKGLGFFTRTLQGVNFLIAGATDITRGLVGVLDELRRTLTYDLGLFDRWFLFGTKAPKYEKGSLLDPFRTGNTALTAWHDSVFDTQPSHTSGKPVVSPPDPGGTGKWKAPGKAIENVFQEELNRLLKEGLSIREKTSINQEERNALEKTELTLRDEIRKIDKDVKAGKETEAQGYTLKLEAEKNYQTTRTAISKKFAEDRAKEEIKVMEAVYSNPGVIMAMPKTDAWSGLLAGLKTFLGESKNQFHQWKDAVLSIVSGVENAFATGISGILSGTMTLSQGMKSIWKGIGQAVIGVLSQMVAKWIVTAIASKIFHIATTTDAEAAAAAQTAASLSAGAAGAWEAYGWIPYVGAALAMAQIAIMEGSVAAAAAGGAAVALAVGGRISSPTLALIGEAGPEIVAPESSFKDWASGFASFGANLARRQDQAHEYDAQGAGYARTAAQGARQGESGGGGTTAIHVSIGQVLDTSQRGLRDLGAAVIDAARAKARESGVVLVPGQVFGGV